MAFQFNPREISIQVKKVQYQAKKFFANAWPVRWSMFKQPKKLTWIVRSSPYVVQVAVGIGAVGVMVSSIFLLFGTYAVSTQEIGQDGGIFREAVMGDMNSFLPVVSLATPAEQKVSRLLFHPLYEVKLPNFVQANQAPQAEIVPILLEREPQWVRPDTLPENPFNRLRFTMRPDITWSDGTPITMDDMQYTFTLLQTEGVSPLASTFAGITFEQIDEKTFDLISPSANPSLIYSANFSPISQQYFGGLNAQRLANDPRQVAPEVTSGWYTMQAENVIDPDNSSATTSNPIRDERTRQVRSVVLNKNPYQNITPAPFIENYIVTRYDTISEVGDTYSLLSGATDSSIDLYSRSLSQINSQQQSSSAVSAVLGLNQQVVPNNTYVTAFANAGRNAENQVGFLVNQSLRKYVMCHLDAFTYDQYVLDAFIEMPQNKRIAPVHLGLSAQMTCPDDLSTILDENYEIDHSNTGGTKRIYLVSGGRRITDIRLKLAWGMNDQTLKTQIQNYFLNEVGLPFSEVVEGSSIQATVATGDYNLAILPLTFANPDPYSVYGVGGFDVTRVSSSNKESILAAQPETLLQRYSNSNLANEDARTQLGQFFANEYVSYHMLQAKTEINFDPEIGAIADDLPQQTTLLTQVYDTVSDWYAQTRREWNWVQPER